MLNCIVLAVLNCRTLLGAIYNTPTHSTCPIYIADIHDCRLNNIGFVNISAAISCIAWTNWVFVKKFICPFAKLFVRQRGASTKSLLLNILLCGKMFFGKIFSAKCLSLAEGEVMHRRSKPYLTAEVYPLGYRRICKLYTQLTYIMH